MNIVEHMSLWYGVASSGYMPRSSTDGSLGRTISNFLRNCQIDFQSGCINPTSYGGVFPFLHIHTYHVLLLEFFILATLIGVKWNLGVLHLHFPDD